MLICYKCGEKNQDDAIYCVRCGRNLVDERNKIMNQSDKSKFYGIRCPSCGNQGDENFTYKTEVIAKQNTISSPVLEIIKCRKCGYVLIRKDHYL